MTKRHDRSTDKTHEERYKLCHAACKGKKATSTPQLVLSQQSQRQARPVMFFASRKEQKEMPARMKSAKRARTGYRSCFLLTNGTTASTRPAAVKRKPLWPLRPLTPA
ncbi:MAG: hypothetical protein WCI01_11675 [Chlorobiaceae bacterium]